MSLHQTASGKVTEDQETSMVYASLNHQITAQLAANLTGQIQYSTFNGGALRQHIANLVQLGA